MLYKNIKTLCKKNNVSITTVEKETGLSNGAICKWSTCSPTIDKLKKVADYFGVSIEELLTEPEEREG